VAAFFWLVRLLATRRLSVHTPLDIPAGILAMMLPVTLLATPLPEITRLQVYRVLVGMALCYAIANHAWDLHWLKSIMAGLVGLSVVLSLAALVSVDWTAGKFALIPAQILKDLPRLVSDQVQPNVMAGTLILLAVFGPAWLLFGGRKLKWWLWWLLLLAIAFGLVVIILTQSRGAWLGLAAGLSVLMILRWPRWGWATLIVICIVGGAFLVSHFSLVQELLNGYGPEFTASGLQVREEIWSRAIQQIKDFPLTGIGMGTFPQVTRALYPDFLAASGEVPVPHAHNLYLQIAVDLGLPGLAAWLFIGFVVLRCSWQVYCVGGRSAGWLTGFGAGLIGSLAALAIHGLVDAATWGTRPAVVVWGLWGLAVAARVFIRRESSNMIPTS